jgi:hypothetical protein
VRVTDVPTDLEVLAVLAGAAFERFPEGVPARWGLSPTDA